MNGHAELRAYRAEIIRTVVDPDRILMGNDTELLAIREFQAGKWMVVAVNMKVMASSSQRI